MIRSDSPQPGIEGQPRVAKILVEAVPSFHQRLLNNVRRVEPRGQSAVEADSHHFPESQPVPLQERAAGLGVAAAGRLKQFFRVGFVQAGMRVVP